VAGVPARVLGDVRSRAHSAGTPQGGA
jgi:hypothetical protein